MFDTWLASSPKGSVLRRGGPVSFALLLHASALLALVFASYWVIETVDDPGLRNPVYFVIPVGPTLAGGGAPPRPRPPQPPATPATPPPRQDEPVQPHQVPDLPAPTSENSDTSDANRETAVGDPAGIGIGENGDSGTGTGDGPGGPGNDPNGDDGIDRGEPIPIESRGDVQRPVPIAQPDPSYPPIAQRAHLEGTVAMRIVVGLDGLVEQVDIVQSNPMFDAAAVEAVKRWRYHPAQLNGRAVRVSVLVKINFHLR